MVVSDVISVIAILISLFCATSCAKIVARNRSQRDFLMDEVKLIKNEYRDFVLAIRRGELKAASIRDTLNGFSFRITTIEKLINNEYRIKGPVKLLSSHEEFQWEITNLDSINNQYNEEFVSFSAEEISKIMRIHGNLDNAFLNYVVEVNRAPEIQPWDRTEENLGF